MNLITTHLTNPAPAIDLLAGHRFGGTRSTQFTQLEFDDLGFENVYEQLVSAGALIFAEIGRLTTDTPSSPPYAFSADLVDAAIRKIREGCIPLPCGDAVGFGMNAIRAVPFLERVANRLDLLAGCIPAPMSDIRYADDPAQRFFTVELLVELLIWVAAHHARLSGFPDTIAVFAEYRQTIEDTWGVELRKAA